MRTLTEKQLLALKLGRVKGIKRPNLKGKPLSIETRKKISKTSIGKHYSQNTEWKKGFTPEGSVIFIKGQTPWNKGKEGIKGKESTSWKGGRTLHQKKYWLIYFPDHPHADNKGYVREHRLVMEKHLGRYLKIEELVHHINHDTKDNRIGNLELVDRSHHIGMHREELYAKRWGTV